MSLYDYPELYHVLLAPEQDMMDDLYAWMDRHLEGSCNRVMDPACGPGTALLPFAEDGCFVAGNDLAAGMVATAGKVLGEWPTELRQGDMRHLPFETGPFDVALNLYASIGHLPDDDAVAEHLEAVARNLRKGGLYFLGLTVCDGEADTTPLQLFEAEPTPIPSGGMAAVAYESVYRDPPKREERIRVVVLTKGVAGAPPQLVEEYTLLTFSAEQLASVIARVPSLELAAAYAMEEDPRAAVELAPGVGDLTLVLRRS